MFCSAVESQNLPQQEDQLLEGAALWADVLVVIHCSSNSSRGSSNKSRQVLLTG
jgi:hypothetical protein